MSGDDLRRWLDASDGGTGAPADDDAPRPRSRRRWWVMAVVAPWALLAVALVAAPAPDGTVHAAPSGSATAPAGPAATAPPADATAPAPARPATATAAAPPEAPAAVAPTAVGMVRDAVTTASDGVTTALDSATPERPRRLGDGTWLVRVHAVVLRGDRRRWRSAQHEVWAAPVGSRDGVVAGLDRPWRVAVAAADREPPAWRPATGDLPAVRAALRGAGLPTGPGLRLERDPALPAVVRAVTASSSAWLHVGGRPRVLGTEEGP